jgi:hypothetical protein
MNLKLKISLILLLLVGTFFFIYTKGTEQSLTTKIRFNDDKTKTDNKPKEASGINTQKLSSNRLQGEKNTNRINSIEADIELIENTETEFPQFASALMRLSTRRNATARDKALALLESKDRRFVHIAFRALGYFDEDEVNKKLGKIITSDDPAQRRNAIQALAWNPKENSGREAILEGLVSSAKPASVDSLMAMGALYKMTSQSDKKDKYFEAVHAIANKTGTPSEKFIAIRTLMQMDSKNPVAKDLWKQLEEDRKKKFNK